jgi:lysophospholipase L1-like esterase
MKKYAVVGLALVLFAAAAYGAEKTKRILIVGDSWTTSLTAQNREGFPSEDVFDQYLEERGFGQFETQGEVTAWGGRKASDWAKPEHLAEIKAELEKYPTIDIVHLIIGGNDFLGNAISGKLAGTTEEQRQVIWDGVIADIRAIVETALSVRDDIRVVLADYDYLNQAQAEVFWKMDFHGTTNEELNAMFVELGRAKMALAQQIPRMEYVQNWGTLYYWFGEPAESVPYPGQTPAFEPYPGGDSTQPMPVGLSPDGIHPNAQAHRKMLGNAFDAFYSKWLSEDQGLVSTADVATCQVPEPTVAQ